MNNPMMLLELIRNHENDIALCNSIVEEIESILPFSNEEEHQVWLNVISTSKDGVFDEMTYQIIKRCNK